MKLLRRRNDMANFKSIELNSLDRKFFNRAMKTSVLTKVEEKQEWKNNFFEGVPSPAGGLLILMPLIYELTDLNIKLDIKNFTPYLTVLISILLVSKIPTLSLKKISISPRATIFLLLGIGVVFIALLFYTLETLLVFGLIYLISIPISVVLFRTQNKKNSKISEESHEDIL